MSKIHDVRENIFVVILLLFVQSLFVYSDFARRGIHRKILLQQTLLSVILLGSGIGHSSEKPVVEDQEGILLNVLLLYFQNKRKKIFK